MATFTVFFMASMSMAAVQYHSVLNKLADLETINEI